MKTIQKTNSIFKAIALIIFFVFASLVSSTKIYAQDTTETNQAVNDSELKTASDDELQERVDEEQDKATTKAENSLVSEAIDALAETENAIEAIDDNQKDKALEALARATGKLDIILARSPELALVPADYTITVIDIAPNDAESIEDTRSQARSALSKGDIPKARELLNNLRSEILTTVDNLPLATYPQAMKEAARLLDSDKTAEAREVLATALSTLVVTETAQPIPVISAENLIDKASDREDKDKSLELLSEARTQLELAQNLGYAESDPEYAELKEEIESLKSNIEEDENTDNAFSQLKSKISGFFDDIF